MRKVSGEIEESVFQDNGQDWIATWHLSPEPQAGTPHGSAGVCLAPSGEIVLVSQDGKRWELPEGRPEGDGDWLATLEREVREEACATVIDASLLGFTRGVCVKGPEEGLVLVRAVWRADIEILPWEPLHETTSRMLIEPHEALAQMTIPDGLMPLFRRFIDDALSISRASHEGGANALR